VAKIAIDIDSTLYDFCSLACRVMGEMADLSIHDGDAERLRNGAYSTSWTEWRTPIDLVGLRLWMDVVDICHTPERILTQIPYDGAPEALWDLHEEHDLVYVSNRNGSTHAPTFRWLDDMGFPIGTGRTKLLCHTDDKLASITTCQYLIDDRPKTLVGVIHDLRHPYLGVPRKAFGLVTPYNRGLTDVPGIYLAPNWPLLGRYLRSKIPTKVGSTP
jgi:hypothetical protein